MREGIDRRPVVAVLAAQAVSLVGGAVTLVAVPWYVLVTTGSPAATGLVSGLTVLAEVVGGFLGGAVVDRLGLRRAAVAARVASAAAVAAVPALHDTAGISYWGLVGLVSLRALCDAPGAAAVNGLLPELAERGRVSLERVNSAVGASVRGSTLLGAPLAAVLIGLIGTANLLWIDAATFLASALLIRLAAPASRSASAERSSTGYGRGLLEGVRYVVRDPLILCIVLTVLVTNFFDSPYAAVILPVYVRQEYGSALPLGLLLTAIAAGGLAGSILYGLVARRLPRRPAYVAAWLGAALGFCGLAVAPNLAIACAALFWAGLAAAPINVIILTVAQERVPAHLRGRVFGSARAMAFAAMPLGALAGGLALQVVSVHAVLVVTAAAYLTAALVNAVNPVFRRLEAPLEAAA